MNDNEFKNDPLFAALNKFAGSKNEESVLPPAIKDAFVGGRKKARIRKYSFRSAFSALVLAITLPALASANVLPAPVKEFVQKVQHAAIAPVKNLINNNEDTQNQSDEVQGSDDSVEEFPVDKEAKAEIKAAKEEAKDEAKAIKEAEKEASKSAKETAKEESQVIKETQKQEAEVAKESAKAEKEAAKESAKTEKESAKDLAKSEKENKGQSKK